MKGSKSDASTAPKKLSAWKKYHISFICVVIACLFFGVYALLINALTHDVSGKAYPSIHWFDTPGQKATVKLSPVIKVVTVTDVGTGLFLGDASRTAQLVGPDINSVAAKIAPGTPTMTPRPTAAPGETAPQPTVADTLAPTSAAVSSQISTLTLQAFESPLATQAAIKSPPASPDPPWSPVDILFDLLGWVLLGGMFLLIAGYTFRTLLRQYGER